MSDNLAQTIKLVFGSEGGYVDHPRDRGGATKFGITASTLGAWRKLGRKAKPEEVRALTPAEAEQILEQQYARPLRYAELPAGLDYALFDYATNSGPAQAVKTLQRVLGVEPDGIMGVKTLHAIGGRRVADIIDRLCDARLRFLHKLSTWSVFGTGWSSRVAHVRKTALQMVDTPAAQIDIVPGLEAANPTDMKASSTPQGKGAIAASIGIAGTAIGSAKDAIQPLTGNHSFIDTLFTLLAAGGAGLAIAGICLVAYGQISRIGAGEQA